MYTFAAVLLPSNALLLLPVVEMYTWLECTRLLLILPSNALLLLPVVEMYTWGCNTIGAVTDRPLDLCTAVVCRQGNDAGKKGAEDGGVDKTEEEEA